MGVGRVHSIKRIVYTDHGDAKSVESRHLCYKHLCHISPKVVCCVARVCEWACLQGAKDPKQAKAFFEGLDKPGNTSNNVGSKVAPIAGLNTLGISLARIDFAPYGENPPHTHPRATEILTVFEGTLYVGFVLSNQNNNTLITKVLNKGDVFVFPIDLIHFQVNIGHTPAVVIAALSGQNPSVITIANSIFGSNSLISDKILAKAFQLDNKIYRVGDGRLRSKHCVSNSDNTWVLTVETGNGYSRYVANIDLEMNESFWKGKHISFLKDLAYEGVIVLVGKDKARDKRPFEYRQYL
ncbi:putative germin-like protein 2-1 [Cinnamomum micranthum f. kanehirae]|uniref:Germin-like protein n=1 Tax=Cinnamomum micranthum f. kanehirae TaxID=337451 RepID=A0A443NTM5_9MAGN|nr:putative germin-like protein 2-1 [Cinnamomum micranthum f. kanehirae]